MTSARRESNAAKLARGASAQAWKNRLGVYVCVHRRDETDIDADEPWVALCDSHDEMIACSTKAAAVAAARTTNEWCNGCTSTRG